MTDTPEPQAPRYPGPEMTNPSGENWINATSVDQDGFNCQVDMLVELVRSVADDGVRFERGEDGWQYDARSAREISQWEATMLVQSVAMQTSVLDATLPRTDDTPWFDAVIDEALSSSED